MTDYESVQATQLAGKEYKVLTDNWGRPAFLASQEMTVENDGQNKVIKYKWAYSFAPNGMLLGFIGKLE